MVNEEWQKLFEIATQERIKRTEAEAERANAFVLRDGTEITAIKSNNSAIKG